MMINNEINKTYILLSIRKYHIVIVKIDRDYSNLVIIAHINSWNLICIAEGWQMMGSRKADLVQDELLRPGPQTMKRETYN